MKLIRHGASGDEKPGLVDAKGGLRDLSGTLRDLAGPGLSRESLDRLARIDPESLPLLPPGTRLGPCVGGTRNFVAIGLNYADHAAETGAAIPAEPIIFNKAPSCIVGPNDTVILPKASAKTDWEVELAVVIGARASYVHANEALRYVAGVCICNDLSEREFQMERGGTWTKGKGCPTFGPLGPWLVTLDEIPDLKNLSMSLDLNGRRMQTGSTATMIFDVAQIVAYVSHFMMLEPGDVITTGTPPGVGLGMKPPRYLRSDDEMVLRIDGLGEQRQRVVAFDDWTAKVAAGEPTN
ncbi:fumarylacetoacetate hydrolase family protein [Methylorubrum extorquens]|jgi:2,4-diketo-3-deoxy-L-fuconate hydrolase|uniref:2-hydroxyhepta-2,4-diene-1,7-dioate isomerase n=2 Tax=Methylorubrum extorquens TaxID=408 RepID=A0A1S1P5R6_METEX|nr:MULTISPECIES: fumarylacetoacetate hydrolase family protein [Methylobacteriaceae]KQO94162.1 2-hydroxyhepta-2,4-diene-1,7-dioate isomerase [Methylobacterium sp. Leaf92]KQP95898.1 2-hydroxyhepta-2,4-diene-1,7-dioate isomerase [Methylobacterium sp. Leaf119]MBA9069114.1 2-keto-4-pentenoate hydratase/2-oxohepta-3-ene-1,7-dioic acid hydratase in catechol pathway [Methylobacterium sp. RAS18]MDF9863609.1 2,4-diketo-3-deoxy-L-fuconate hydrolase [Methylorubrum pseudosasae]MDH6637211.1 2,4-diketo-3-deo